MQAARMFPISYVQHAQDEGMDTQLAIQAESGQVDKESPNAAHTGQRMLGPRCSQKIGDAICRGWDTHLSRSSTDCS